MLVFGTEMHLVTFVFVALETILFFFQIVFYLIRPQDKYRLWYLTLLTLLLFYNIASGLFPDGDIPIPIFIQNIVAYGAGFCTASFFPYYFYKAFNLRRLKFHALYGIWLFLIAPYVAFFVIAYSINKDLESARRFGLVIPFFYSLTLIWAITRAIFPNYRESKYTRSISEIVGVYLAVAPWTALTVVVYLDAGQPIEASLTNGGFLVITILYIARTIQTYRLEYKKLQNYDNSKSKIIDEIATRFSLTSREKQVVQLIAEGMRFGEIAQTLFISERTVSTHAERIYRKVGVKGRLELLRKFNFTLSK